MDIAFVAKTLVFFFWIVLETVCLAFGEVRLRFKMSWLAFFGVLFSVIITSLRIFNFYVACIVIWAIISLVTKLANRLDYPSGVSLDGKVAIITGVSKDGIGFSVAKSLAMMGAKIVVASRNKKATEALVAELIQITKNSNIKFIELDVSSIESVQKFVNQFNREYKTLDLLFNNAGLNSETKELNADGLEMTFAVNYFGHFVLTNLLLDMIKANKGRIINTSSIATEFSGPLSLDKIYGDLISFPAYAHSKFCQALFSRELQSRLGNEAYSFAYHPGAVNSRIFTKSSLNFFIQFFFQLRFRNIDQGAATALFLAVDPNVTAQSGKFFYSNEEYPTITQMTDKESDRTALWTKSEELMTKFLKKQ